MQPFCLNLLVDIRRYKRPYPLFVPGPPEVQNGFHKADDPVAALNVTLLSQEVDKGVLTQAYFIDFGGDVPEPPLCSDVIEICGEETGQLLDQVINRADVAI